MITGTLQQKGANDFGYSYIKVQGTRYGADSKGAINAEVGDSVEFEAYQRQDKKDPSKFWPTLKLSTFKKVAGNGSVAAQSTGTVPAARSAGSYQSSGSGAERESYWTDKAATDSAREPRIAYQGALERAIQFVSLAISSGSFVALSKVKKDADKLDVLAAFVDETATRFFKDSWFAEAPLPAPKQEAKPASQPLAVAGVADEGEWE